MRKITAAAALAAALAATALSAHAFESGGLGQMGDINDLAANFGKDEDFHLSDDFFERNGWDGFGDFGNLGDAERKFDYSFKIEELAEEYENADYKFKDDDTYVAVYKSRGMEVPYTTTHVYLKNSDALKLKPSGEGIIVTDAEGKEIYSVEMKKAKGIMESSGKTTGKETALRSDGQFYTPDEGMTGKELKDAGVIALFKSSWPFFWTDLRELDALEAIGYGSDLADETESETETEDDGIELGEFETEGETEDKVDHEENVTAAIGSIGAGEYFIFQSREGMTFDEVGAIMASYGCEYSAPIQSSEAYLKNKQVFGGSVKDGYAEDEEGEDIEIDED